MCNSKEKYDYREIYITLFVSYINCWQRDNGKERELIIKEKEREGDIDRDREKERKRGRSISGCKYTMSGEPFIGFQMTFYLLTF